MKILVTGGCGYLGSHLVLKLIEAGHEVTILDKLIFGIPHHFSLLKNPPKIIQGDIRDSDIVAQALDEVDTVIHLAGVSNDPTAEFNPKDSMDVADRGTRILVDHCEKTGVQNFIFASSCSVYYTDDPVDDIFTEKTPVNPQATYSKGKYIAEQIILASLIPNKVAFRMGTLHGYTPGRMRFDLFINAFAKDAIKHKRLIVHNEGDMWRPVLSLSEASDAYLWAVENPMSGVYNLVSDNYRVIDVAKMVKGYMKSYLGIGIEIVKHQVPFNRSYRVQGEHSFTKQRPRPITSDIQQLTNILRDGTIDNPEEMRYYNIKWMEHLVKMEALLKQMGGSVFGTKEK